MLSFVKCYWIGKEQAIPSMQVIKKSITAENSVIYIILRETLTWSNFTWSKVSVKFGVWSNALFVTRSKVLIMTFNILSFDQIISHVFTRLKVLLMSFWVIFNFWSSEKIRLFFFGTWSKVLIMVFFIFSVIKTFDLVPKKNLRILSLDLMYCWLRNRAKN